MVFSKSSAVLALNLAASTASAGTSWADWSASSGAPYQSTCSASTVTVTATTTLYASTVFVGPGDCTSTVTVSGCNGGPTGGPGSSPMGPNPVSPVGTSTAPGPKGSWPAGPATGTPTTTATVSPTAGPKWGGGGSPLDPGISGSVVVTGSDAWSWTVPSNPTYTQSIPPPTYSGWSDWNSTSGSGSNGTLSGPAPGSPNSNVTAPNSGLNYTTSCNSADDRSMWCDGISISTDTTSSTFTTGAICSYDWVITNTTLDFDGSPKLALAVNGQVPGPAIECNFGDIIRVKVSNAMTDNATAIHWHGITQHNTNDQDGVPGVTECAIAPGQSRTYTFRASQFGTSWYHSHYITQYGDGIRGPIIIHGPATANYDIDMGTVMVDDTFGANTASQQNSIISHVGPLGTSNYLLNGKNTKPDLSAGQHQLWSVQPGKKHLFRFINSASQNMFSITLDNHVMTVIAADFVPIVPYQTTWLNIGIGQRYDVIIEMNQPVSGYFLRAVTQTLCPSACDNTGLGQANGIVLYEGAPAYLPTTTAGDKTLADFATCNDEPLASLVPYVKKGAGSSSAFAASASTVPAGQVANVATSDDGNVFRWFINNGAININYTQPTLQTLASGVSSNSSLISNPITLNSQNQWVYFILQNQFFAFHPMHLHGHDFSILGQGQTPWDPSLVSTLNFDNPPRRDTAMLAGSASPASPAGYTVIGFETDNPGAWLMHCHIVWHVDGGLALQFIERPDDITATQYVSTQAFTDECSAMSAYVAQSPAHDHSSGESGLKRRASTYFDEQLRKHADVVRRSDNAEKRYIDSFVKRGLGDGYKPRHGARR